jgi:hypothetical protein
MQEIPEEARQLVVMLLAAGLGVLVRDLVVQVVRVDPADPVARAVLVVTVATVAVVPMAAGPVAMVATLVVALVALVTGAARVVTPAAETDPKTTGVAVTPTPETPVTATALPAHKTEEETRWFTCPESCSGD